MAWYDFFDFGASSTPGGGGSSLLADIWKPISQVIGTSPAPSAGTYFTPGGGGGSWVPDWLSWDNIQKAAGLGMAGLGVGGAVSQMLGRPPEARQTPQVAPGAQASLGQGSALLQMLQGALANPQIPPGLAGLVEQAYQPQMGDIATQAIQSARRRGFYGGADLLQGGPAGAIAGPMLSNLQGQMAGSKLGLYQNWLNSLLGGVQGAGGLAGAYPVGQRTQAPKPTLLETLKQLGPIFQGAGQMMSTGGR